MKSERKQAREMLLSLKTRADLEGYLNSLNITDEEREIAMLVFGRGWSLTRIQLELGYTKSQLKRRMARIYDKMV